MPKIPEKNSLIEKIVDKGVCLNASYYKYEFNWIQIVDNFFQNKRYRVFIRFDTTDSML